jgi:hypothetical protein
MVVRATKSKVSVEGRRTIGAVLALVGLAILVSCFVYTASYRSRVFVVNVATPESDWPPGIGVGVVMGIVLLAAGVRLLRPSLAKGLLVSGTAVTLTGIFEYWWNEGLISGDGYPSPNWALTIPISAVGVMLLMAGILLRRSRTLDETPIA